MPAPAAASSRAPLAAWLGLAVLMAFYLLSFTDKQLVPLMANILRPRLNLSDSQLGLLQGFVFSIPYAAANLMFGWAADRFSRRRLLALGVVLWSLAGASTALASGFGSLAISRAGVGFGEGALVPISLSIIASLFPRDRVTFAVGVFYTGASLGGVLGLTGGGAAIEAFVRAGNQAIPGVGVIEPWQAAFLSVGLPGVLLALLAFTIRIDDRDRRAFQSAGRAEPAGASLAGYLWEHKAFLIPYAMASSLTVICAYTIIAWAAAYFGRAFAWDHARIGLTVGLGMGCGGVGNVAWGYLADHLIRRGRLDGVYRVYIPLLILATPVAAVAFLVRDPVVCLTAFGLMSVVFSGTGAMAAPLQIAAPPHLRARLTGVNLVFGSFMGLGFGPVLAGVLVDYLFHDPGKLGPAITLTLTVCSFAAAGLMLFSRKAYVRAVQQAHAAPAGPA